MSVDLEQIAMFATLCREAVTARKWLKAKFEERMFSKHERDILRAAAGDGMIQLIPCNGFNTVYAGDQLFEGKADPAEHSRYLDAFATLCDRGLVLHSGMANSDGTPSPLFKLNGPGFDIAREMKEKSD